MRILVLLTLLSSVAFTGEGKDHSHSMGGEIEHAWPIAVVFVVLIIAGFSYSYFSKKK